MQSRKRSAVWMHFDEVPDGNKGKCKYCFVQVSCTGGSTSNLTRHLRTKHKSVPLESLSRVPLQTKFLSHKSVPSESWSKVPPQTVSLSQTTLGPDVVSQANSKGLDVATTSSLFSNSDLEAAGSSAGQISERSQCQLMSIHTSNKTQSSLISFVDYIKPVSLQKSKTIDKQLLKMIVKEYHPFSIVEDVEFKNFVKELCPGYSLPSRKTVTNSLLPMYYNIAMEDLKQQISPSNVCSVSLTTDCWTSINNESFIAITAHYINEDCEIHSRLLECESFQGSHTGERLSAALKAAATRWELTNFVSSITTDNASNIVLAVKNTQWRHVRCFAHSVNLVTQKGLNHLNSTLAKVKAIVEHFKRSSSNLAKLQEIQEQMGLPKQKLKQDVETRWNSTFDMLVRFHKNKEPLLSTTAVLQLDDKFYFSREEWTSIHQAIKVLSVFNAVTIEISGEKMVTLSKTIVLARVMVKHVNKSLLEPQLTDNIKSMCLTLKDELSSRFKDLESNELHSQALLLDPRFKKDGFADKSKFQQTFESLKKKATAIKLPNEEEIAEKDRSPEAKTRAHDEFFVDLYEDYKREKSPVVQPLAASIVELDSYMADVTLDHDKDPLQYWKLNKHRFPRLFKLAQRRLSIPATSVPCERIFSKAGYTMSERRSRLLSGKLKQILFLNHNWK